VKSLSLGYKLQRVARRDFLNVSGLIAKRLFSPQLFKANRLERLLWKQGERTVAFMPREREMYHQSWGFLRKHSNDESYFKLNKDGKRICPFLVTVF